LSQLTLQPVSELANVRHDWSRLARRAGNVFSTWEWADSWHRHLGFDSKLAIAAALRATGETAALLPVCVARERPVRLMRFVGYGLSDQLGPISAPADRAAAAAALRQHVTDAVGNAGLFLGERLWGPERMASELGAVTVVRAPSPVLPVEGRSFDDYLSSRSRNFRDQVRRRERKLRRQFKLVFRLTDDPATLDTDMRTLMRLHALRWSNGESGAFAAQRRPFHLEFSRRALENGWLRLWTMELDDVPVAAWYGFRYAGVETFYQSGRDPGLERENVGFVLLCHTIRSAFQDGMKEYRFGLGGEPYKSRFTEHDPGLDTVALAFGIRGHLALAALKGVLCLPDDIRAWIPRR
jgi:CelD/BcsL family acetyltransferase involved in cellulose biosynthesis